MPAQYQLRSKSGHVLTVDKPSGLLDAILEAQDTLQDAIISTAVEMTQTPAEPSETGERYAEYQLIDWTYVLIQCPGCQCYPCKPGHLNGHTEMWLPSAGDVVKVRI